MMIYALVILVGAFLLFQVQPIMGKYILPWFGGGPGVWTVCLLFFQVMLLVGYFYAHVVTRKMNLKLQCWCHIALLLLSLLLLPILPDAATWQSGSLGDPTFLILGLLLVTIGLPYVLLASTAPLLQRWFAHSFPGRSPYRLYALSNSGSLLALLSFPVLVEPYIGRGGQAISWSWVYAVFAALCILAALITSRRPAAASDVVPDATDSASGGLGPFPRGTGWWLGLAACGSVLLMATTNQLCMEVAVVPFLWVYPLTIYLLTFILCFDSPRWYRRNVFAPLLFVAATAGYLCVFGAASIVFWKQIIGYGFWLFVGCMVCHGELVRAKPDPSRLTSFYLAVAAGGALGGLFVALVAPVLFPGFWEFPLSILACCVMGLLLWSSDWEGRAMPRWIKGCVGAWLVLVVLGMGAFLLHSINNVADVGRNFYGVLRVVDRDGDLGPFRVLRHGRINHGFQFLEDDKRLWPTSYFGHETGVGLALGHHPRRTATNGLHVAVVGLGAGSIAAHGQEGDHIRFYEINPMVQEMARTYFTFLEDSKAKVDVVMGDARIMLEAELVEGSRGYDVLILDAFSSDAIPIHLLTAECIEVYRQHLVDGGLLVLHVSNNLIDLLPVTQAIADQLAWRPLLFHNKADAERTGVSASTWVVFSSDPDAFAGQAEVQPFVDRWPEVESIAWTDDFASLWRVLRWK